MTVIVGIDPGYSGAVAFLWPNMKLEIHDMPVLKNAKGKKELNLHILHELLTPEGDEAHVAFIEKVHAMSGQGVSSMFRFGETYGATQMAVAAHGMVMQYVPPTTWKKHFKLSRDKGVSRGLATQRFPDCADQFKRVKDDGRAEAALIALYGLETLCSVKFWQKERAE
jgi:crossover junction endodeoxyribonuclease RuvC